MAGCGPAETLDAVADKPEAMEMLEADVLSIAIRPWPTIVRSQGSLYADERTVVGAKVASRVHRVHIELDDFVKAGEPLVTLSRQNLRNDRAGNPPAGTKSPVPKNAIPEPAGAAGE